jgi:hypothetical protein
VCIYLLVANLARFQRHSRERGLLLFASYITLFHAGKVAAYSLLYQANTWGFFIEWLVYTIHYGIFGKIIFVTLIKDAIYWKRVSTSIRD